MSKLGCVCGHVIRDNTTNIPYKAIFLRDQDWKSYTNYRDDIDSFLEALRNGSREKWISDYFSKSYPTDLSDSSIIDDIISNHQTEYEGDLYQCENCGRIKIQVQDKNLFASFIPEDDNFRDIFKKYKID